MNWPYFVVRHESLECCVEVVGFIPFITFSASETCPVILVEQFPKSTTINKQKLNKKNTITQEGDEERYHKRTLAGCSNASGNSKRLQG